MIAPDLDLFATPAKAPAAVCKPPSPEVRARLAKLRDEMQALASRGRFTSAVAREWEMLPSTWRMSLLVAGNLGEEDDLQEIARSSWKELKPPTRAAIRLGARDARRHLGRLRAMVAQD